MCLFLIAGLASAEPAGKITCKGKVVDEAGKPIAGASVRLYDIEVSMHPDYKLVLAGEATTKSDGVFSFTRKSAGFGQMAGRIGVIVAHKTSLALDGANWMSKDNMEVTLKLGKPSKFAGMVVDETGKPIPGAQVCTFLILPDPTKEQPRYILGLDPLDWLIATTDKKGRFAFENIPARSTAEFIASAPGRARIFTLPDRPTGPLGQFSPGKTDIRIVLPREAVIEGAVIDKKTGKPVGGVKVFAQGARSPSDFGGTPCVSGKDGRFRIPALRADSYKVKITPPEKGLAKWVAKPVSVVTEAGKTKTGVKIELAKGGVIEVLVTDKTTGKPVEGAHVGIQPVKGEGYSHGRTDKDGIARILLIPGEYRVQHVSKHREYGTTKVDKAVTVVEGKTEKLTVQLGPVPKITGVVKDQAGKPVAGAKVRLLPVGHEDNVTDENGHFKAIWQIHGWSPDTFYLIARHEGCNLAAAVEIEKVAGKIDVKLQPAATITGLVVDPDGKPITGARINVNLQVSDWGSPIGKSVKTNAKGRYKANALPPGYKYTIHASRAGYGDDSVTVELDEVGKAPMKAENIVLAVANLSISGTVVDESGKPVAGAIIYLYGNGQPHRQGTTDAAGKFTIKKICKGKVHLHASTRGPNSLSGDTQTDAGATDVKLVLRKQRGRARPAVPTLLLGKPLPKLKEFGIELPDDATKGKAILVCFWDMQQRPSRRAIRILAAKGKELAKKGVVVLPVHASAMEAEKLKAWLEKNKVPFPAGCVPVGEKKTREILLKWGVGGLPWLILTDDKHIVRTEGFQVTELGAKMKEILAK